MPSATHSNSINPPTSDRSQAKKNRSVQKLTEGTVVVKKTAIRYAMSRRRRLAILYAIIFLLLPALVLLDRLGGQKLRRDYLPQDMRSRDTRKYHGKSFKVINIVDGDTLDLNVKDGKFDHTRIRLLGIDTPETGGGQYQAMYYSAEATDAATALALNRQVTVLIDDIADVRDRYGRLLAYIVLPDGKTLNEKLLRQGFGYADSRFPHTHFDKYFQLQKDAIDSKAGLWKSVTPEQLPPWLQRENPNILNNAKR